MRIKILLACVITSLVAALVNHFIMKTVEGSGSGLIVYQFITVIFVGAITGILFALEGSDFESKLPKIKKQNQEKAAWVMGK